jgi:hypothetical protein
MPPVCFVRRRGKCRRIAVASQLPRACTRGLTDATWRPQRQCVSQAAVPDEVAKFARASTCVKSGGLSPIWIHLGQRLDPEPALPGAGCALVCARLGALRQHRVPFPLQKEFRGYARSTTSAQRGSPSVR